MADCKQDLPSELSLKMAFHDFVHSSFFLESSRPCSWVCSSLRVSPRVRGSEWVLISMVLLSSRWFRRLSLPATTRGSECLNNPVCWRDSGSGTRQREQCRNRDGESVKASVYGSVTRGRRYWTVVWRQASCVCRPTACIILKCAYMSCDLTLYRFCLAACRLCCRTWSLSSNRWSLRF